MRPARNPLIMFLTLKCREFDCEKAPVEIGGYDELMDAIRDGWLFLNCPDGIPSSDQVTAAQVSAALAQETLQWICPDCAVLLECH